MFLAKKLNKGAGVVSTPDPQFNYVTMLLHGDGTNGAQNNTFLDSSTNNFTITRNGNTTQGSFSPYGSNWANYFGSANGNALLVRSSGSELTFTGDFTLETWVYPTSGSSSGYSIIFSSNSPTEQIAYYYTDGRIGCYFSNGANGVSSAGKLSMNAWSHVAVVRNGSTVKIYVNGVDTGVSISGTINVNVGTIGGYQVGATGYNVWGYLSNVRLGTTAVYTSNFTPSTTPLTAISGTVLLTCQSNQFIDNSASPKTITTEGSPSVQRFNPFGTSTAYSTSVIGGSGYFDGSGDYLSAPSNSAFAFGTGDFTIEAYVNFSVVGSNDGVLIELRSSGGTSNGFVFNCRPTTGGYLLNFYTSGSANVGSIVMPYNAWNHVAITRSGSTVRLFSNGAVSATITNSNNFSDTPTPEIGQSSLYSSSSVTGYISNMRLVKGTAVYTSAFTPPTAPLTAISGTSLLLSTINGAIYDNAMMNNLETVGNAQISTSVVKYGTGSLYFDGTGDSLSVLNTQTSTPWGTESWTIEGWVYRTTSGAFQAIYVNGYPIQIYLNINTIEIYISSTNGFSYIVNGLTGPLASIALNTWAHFAVVRNGSNFTVYVNGVGGITVSSSTAIAFPSNANATIGDAPLFGAYGYTGYIDDLRITKGYARYNTNFTPPTAAFPNTGPL